MAELADAGDLKPSDRKGREGSSPSFDTKIEQNGALETLLDIILETSKNYPFSKEQRKTIDAAIKNIEEAKKLRDKSSSACSSAG